MSVQWSWEVRDDEVVIALEDGTEITVHGDVTFGLTIDWTVEWTGSGPDQREG